MTPPVPPHAAELAAILDELAALQAQQAAIPPQIFLLVQRAKALRAYAMTLPQAPIAAEESANAPS